VRADRGARAPPALPLERRSIGIFDLLDIALVALLLWAAIVGLRRSGATLALVGLAILGLVYLAALRLDLQLTTAILRGFFAVFVVVLVVVFQEDLRRLFEQIAVWGLGRRAPAAASDAADVLVRGVTQLVGRRTGALFVLPGREPVERHLHGGVSLEGRLSEPLLLSLFDPGSPGHDGAVLIEGDRVVRFAVHLPLSGDHAQLGAGGTRHAAALGLAERCDALCVVVSEERGTVSVARDGQLRALSGPDGLVEELRGFLREMAPEASTSGAWRRLLRGWPEALLATTAAAVMWVGLVAGQGVVEVERQAKVLVENMPEGYALERVDPPEVTVVAEGRRRDLLLENDGFRVRLDAVLVQLGRRTFTVSPASVEHPEGVRVLDVDPERVRLSVRRVEEPDRAPEGAAAPG